MDNAFFETSPLSRKIKLPVRIILHEQKMTASQLADLKRKGEFTVTEKLYDLEAGGEILGTGKIMEKEGKSFFQLIEEEVNEK